jgi:5-methylcytosine-specific restriction endonuclease McrA
MAKGKYIRTPEIRKATSIRSKGFKYSEESRRKMSLSQKGRKHSPETIHKMSQWQIGKKLSDETKRKISESEKGKKVFISEEHRKKLSKALKGRKMSEQDKVKMSIGRRGKLTGSMNHAWKGGVTSVHQKIRHSVEYRLWRTAVFERDNYTCIWCGDNRGGNLNADHIKPFALYPELRFAIDNGRTLCVPCHKTTDTYGRQALKFKE